MQRLWSKQLLIFAVTLIGCIALIFVITQQKNSELYDSNERVVHTNIVIIKTLRMLEAAKSMVSNQRGYLLSGEQSLSEVYRTNKQRVSDLMAELNTMVADNPAQISRLSEFRYHYLELTKLLEKKVLAYDIQSISPETIHEIENHEADIVRIANLMLDEEFSKLRARLEKYNASQSQMFSTVIGGVVAMALLLIILNALLYHTKQNKKLIEKTLLETEERLRLAIEGADDGIFDWNIKTGTMYLSPSYERMLGYEPGSIGTRYEDIGKLVHPDDRDYRQAKLQNYLDGKLSEYSSEYRMLHAEGRHVWINARAKLLRDENGHPVRLVGTHRDVTYRKESEKNLKNAKDEAEKANRAKSDFLAHMSHEIRTPLTAISGIAEILSKSAKDLGEKNAQLVQTLGASTMSLKELVNDILDFSKIERGEIDLFEEEFPLVQLCSEVISIMAVRANEKKIDFSFDYSDIEDIEFDGDKSRIRQILLNLIGNAIKFTDKGSVRVTMYIDDKQTGEPCLYTDIEDTGMGIDEKCLHIIFDEFKQGDSSVSRKYGGTGLGLPISKNLANMMGGDIKVRSELGKGSVFTLVLPFKGEFMDDDGIDAALDNKIRKRFENAIKEEKRALIVEDYEGNIVVLTYLLDEIGLKYDLVRNGQEALNQWKENHYDVILMDIQMPVMDGLTATRAIREFEQEKGLERTPIIGMTAHALVGDKEKCIAAGMSDYLSKPINEKELKEKILLFIEKDEGSISSHAASA